MTGDSEQQIPTEYVTRLKRVTAIRLGLLKLWYRLLESPAWKTFFAAVGTVATAVLSGAFVAEITTPTGLGWQTFYKAPAFYGLISLVCLLYLYNRAVYMHEREVSRFSDIDFCTAYMRSKLLPEAAEKYKELIRSGQGGELKKATDELRKILR